MTKKTKDKLLNRITQLLQAIEDDQWHTAVVQCAGVMLPLWKETNPYVSRRLNNGQVLIGRSPSSLDNSTPVSKTGSILR